MDSDKMTHKELIERAKKWLYNTVGCSVVLTELVSGRETPDAIGFKWGESILVECKASKSDFEADKKKFVRINPKQGMGTYRFYMCEAGLIDSVPEKWGLLWACKKSVKKLIGPNGNIWGHSGFRHNKKSSFAEITLLTSALRRVRQNGDLEKIYNKKGA